MWLEKEEITTYRQFVAALRKIGRGRRIPKSSLRPIRRIWKTHQRRMCYTWIASTPVVGDWA